MTSNIMASDQDLTSVGNIGEKHGDTIIATLRSIYGPSFAPDCQPTDMLSDVLAKLDETSLAQLIRDHRSGDLKRKLIEQS